MQLDPKISTAHRPAPRLAAMTRWVLLAGGLSLTAHHAQAASLTPLAPEQLAAASPVVVEGRVSRVDSGVDPQTGRVATYVWLEVTRSLRGADGHEQLVVRVAGGRNGEAELVIDAAPTYRVGERILGFLRPAADGALRTTGMLLGKYRVDADAGGLMAVRELAGAVPLRGLEPVQGIPFESIERAVASAAEAPSSGPSDRTAVAWQAKPPELDRVRWQGPPHGSVGGSADGDMIHLDRNGDAAPTRPRFTALAPTNPIRWTQIDAGQPIPFRLQRTNDPLNDAQATIGAIQSAMAAWRNVPHSRLDFALTDDDFNYTGSQTGSPAGVFSGLNTILFDDPYNDIDDLVQCGGVLAIGGYWAYGGPEQSLNGQTFRPAAQGFVIFNNGLSCYLDDADDLAEVAAHELGHAAGFGHSTASGSPLMRATAYGNRGATLSADDADAAHCHYPHTVQLLDPAGGESWTAGELQRLRWSSSSEAGGAAGTIDLEYSIDDVQWSVIAKNAPNVGYYDWTLPMIETDSLRVRVTRGQDGDDTPPGYPQTCTAVASAGTATIEADSSFAGAIDPTDGGGLLLDKAAGNALLQWSDACSGSASQFGVYYGDLAMLRNGMWSHTPLSCSVDGTRQLGVALSGADSYYLVAPQANGAEGSLGRSSSGAPRPASGAACAPRESDSDCDS